MIKTLCAALALSIGAAGCGSSSGGSSSATGSTAASATSATSLTTNTTTTSRASHSPTTAASTSAPRSNAASTRPVRACKSALAQETSLPASFRAKLRRVCEVAGSGKAEQVRRIEHNVCVAVIKQQLPVSAQKAAEASCPQP